MADKPNYYHLLELGSKQFSTLSQQELKAAYRRALLQYHPDKNNSINNGKTTDKLGLQVSVDDIALAYKTLSEPGLKDEYDRWLQSTSGHSDPRLARPHHTGLETVDLDDLTYDPKTSRWTWSCRCGDDKGYIVTEAELEKNVEDGEVIVGCKGCSLWLRVLFDVEE